MDSVVSKALEIYVQFNSFMTLPSSCNVRLYRNMYIYLYCIYIYIVHTYLLYILLFWLLVCRLQLVRNTKQFQNKFAFGICFLATTKRILNLCKFIWLVEPKIIAKNSYELLGIRNQRQKRWGKYLQTEKSPTKHLTIVVKNWVIHRLKQSSHDYRSVYFQLIFPN